MFSTCSRPFPSNLKKGILQLWKQQNKMWVEYSVLSVENESICAGREELSFEINHWDSFVGGQ